MDWNNILSPGEKVVQEFGVAPKYIRFELIIGLLTLPIFGIGLISILVAIYHKNAYQYAFTDKRVLSQRGWLSKKLSSVDYDRITDTHTSQGFSEKLLFNSGSLLVNTSGTTLFEINLDKIENPYARRQQLMQLIEQHRSPKV